MCSRGCSSARPDPGLEAAREVIARHVDDSGGFMPTLQEAQRE